MLWALSSAITMPTSLDQIPQENQDSLLAAEIYFRNRRAPREQRTSRWFLTPGSENWTGRSSIVGLAQKSPSEGSRYHNRSSLSKLLDSGVATDAVTIWDLLPKKNPPASSFVSFVTSNNMVSKLSTGPPFQEEEPKISASGISRTVSVDSQGPKS